VAAIYVKETDNGFIMTSEPDEADGGLGFSKQIVMEGKDERKIGETVLLMFKKRRKSPASSKRNEG